MIQQASWFEHTPILSHILLYLSPQFVLLEGRRVSRLWNDWISSEPFSQFYFNQVVVLVDFTNSPPLKYDDGWDLINSEMIFNYNDFSIPSILVRMEEYSIKNAKSNYVKSLPWNEHFYFKILFMMV